MGTTTTRSVRVVLREVGPNWDWEVQRDAAGVVRVGTEPSLEKAARYAVLAAEDELLGLQ